jgi:ribosomal protein S18 acetylase RimI-like enzyme
MVTRFVTDLDRDTLVLAIESHRRGMALDWAGVAGATVRERSGFLLVVSGYRVPWANNVVSFALSGPEADRAIDECAAAFRAAGVPATWTVSPLSTPADLAERLTAHGFQPEEPLPWMAAGLRNIPGADPPDGLTIERVTDQELHRGWLTAMDKGFGMEPETVRMLDEMGAAAPFDEDATWVRFVGSVDGRPVASSGLLLHAGVAGLFNVATLPAARRRGYGTAMTLAALGHARSLGYEVAILGTSDLGRGVYEGLGFHDVCKSRGYVLEVSPPSSPRPPRPARATASNGPAEPERGGSYPLRPAR